MRHLKIINAVLKNKTNQNKTKQKTKSKTKQNKQTNKQKLYEYKHPEVNCLKNFNISITFLVGLMVLEFLIRKTKQNKTKQN